MNQSDEDLAIKVQQGDSESFGILVERYEGKLKRYAKKFLFDNEDVEDLVQNVFLKAYSNIQSFNAKMKFSPWIYRIAHNEFINKLKKRNSESLYFFDMDTIFPSLSFSAVDDDKADEVELKKNIEQWLGKLDTKYKEPIILYFFEELSYKDISEILKIPISTVGVRINRGKQIIRKFYEDSNLNK